jgi:hypothetical protein
MKSLYCRKIVMSNFIYKIQQMCVLPASHLKVHAAIEQGLADEQSVFATDISQYCIDCALGPLCYIRACSI